MNLLLVITARWLAQKGKIALYLQGRSNNTETRQAFPVHLPITALHLKYEGYPL